MGKWMLTSKKSRIVAWLIAAVLLAACAVLVFAPVGSRASADTIASDTDRFELTESEYAADEGFVFTATASFVRGQAAGLVFGATDGEYWVFNIDRAANLVKLLYFADNGEGIAATELITDYFIGNDKMTDGERALVNPKVANIDKVQLKVVITPDADGVHAEFFADNIKRFGVDNDIILDNIDRLPDGVGYNGGKLGYNVFNSEVAFDDVYIGASDYSYYSELYRQQYHFSQYAHWNNDPNGLVYYDGYYHLFYQHHPFSNYWSDMYWGHARSLDLAHWELLPICLFPDRDFGEGDGYMWSGTAMVYRKGMSDAIDALNWYPAGNGTGLIAFYTRDGGKQDQMIMSSDDGGMTWTKRKLIPQSLATGDIAKTDCRDPKVFPVKKDGDKVTLWGMALTGMKTFDVWFLQSTDLYNWSNAGGFKVAEDIKSECPDIVTLTASDNTVHNVLTLTGRNYIVGEIGYDDEAHKIVFKDNNGAVMSTPETVPTQRMDYGPDSYATQTYYIDDPASEYFGKTVSVSWFSGVPGGAASIESGLLADARKVWNGSGMTIPVIWGLERSGDGYVLTQTPIVKDGAGFADIKTELYCGENVSVGADGENILSDVNGHCLEIAATVDNPRGAAVAFKINMRGDEYVEIGWNAEDGYYVDRTHAGDAGLSMGNYRVKYTSGARTSEELTFYILSDNGGVEVFCDDFKISFYALTFSSPYATGASFSASGDVTASVTVNAIASVWRDDNSASGETVLHVDADSVELDRSLTPEKELMAYSTAGGEIEFAVTSGENAISIEKTSTGAKIKALGAGSATVSVTCGNVAKTVGVTVYDGTADSDLEFSSDGIVSGNWFVTNDGILGVQTAGDGFLLSQTTGDDFTYSASFKLSGAAAAMVFRAKADMSDYIIVNYDHNGRIVKLWSPRREIARAEVGGVDVNNIVLTAKAKGKDISVSINGHEVISVTLGDDEPSSGLFGLNACAARVTFGSIALVKESYDYGGTGALTVKGDTDQPIVALYNVTDGNVKINSAYYTRTGRAIAIMPEYFATLDGAGAYRFRVVGTSTTFEFVVNVSAVPETVVPSAITVDSGCNAVINIGLRSVDAVTLNGRALESDEYKLTGGVLTVLAGLLSVGDNTLEIDDITVTVTVVAAKTSTVNVNNGGDNTVVIAVCSSLGGVIALGGVAALVTLLLIKKKRGGAPAAQKPSDDDEGPQSDETSTEVAEGEAETAENSANDNDERGTEENGGDD